MADEESCARATTWVLVYTKRDAEAWAQGNLKRQGFATVLPWVATRSGMRPLFPRYLFVGYASDAIPSSVRSTYGVQYIVMCGDRPSRVPGETIVDVQSRMDSRGVVHLERAPAVDPLYAKRERERVRALVKLAAAGFRVRSA